MSTQTELPPPPAKTADERGGQPEDAFLVLAAVHGISKAFEPFAARRLCDFIVEGFLRTLADADRTRFDIRVVGITGAVASTLAQCLKDEGVPELVPVALARFIPGFDAESSPDETA